MNYNIISYIIYLLITIYITVIVGWKCYKNGLVYVESIFKDEKLSQAINKILLIGYYLTNIGYAIMTLKNTNEITNTYQLMNEVSYRVATIVLILAGLHYMNVIVLSLWRKSSESKININ
jgi:hypothetical protein